MGNKSMYSNYRGISLLNVVGKVYGSVNWVRERESTRNMLLDEQDSFRDGRVGVFQVFALRTVCEKY